MSKLSFANGIATLPRPNFRAIAISAIITIIISIIIIP